MSEFSVEEETVRYLKFDGTSTRFTWDSRSGYLYDGVSLSDDDLQEVRDFFTPVEEIFDVKVEVYPIKTVDHLTESGATNVQSWSGKTFTYAGLGTWLSTYGGTTIRETDRSLIVSHGPLCVLTT